MANKEIMDQITAERLTRTRELHVLPFDAADGIAHGVISKLVSSWQREADLLSRSQRKGWQSEVKTLAAAIALLRLELIALEKLSALPGIARREPIADGTTASWTDPQALRQLTDDAQSAGLGQLIAGDMPCSGELPHDAHTWIGPQSKRWQCAGRPGTVTPASDVAAYLSGASDALDFTMLPTSRAEMFSMSEAEMKEFEERFKAIPDSRKASVAVIERLGTHLYRESAVHEEIDQTMPDVRADPLPMFRESETPATMTRVPPNGAHLVPYTWTDLATPANPTNIPDNMSPSQLSTLDTCAAQARIGRYDGNPGIPLWGAVGGSAFHGAVEEIERDIATNGVECIADYVTPGESERLWSKHFQKTIVKTVTESGVPSSMWYASNRGRENYSWWLIEGGQMLRGYIDYRVTHDDGRGVLVLPDGRPAIELELNLSVAGVPVKTVLDIVWQLPDGSLEIWDHKTRQDFMGPIVDTIQLGTQGWALDAIRPRLTNVWEWGTISARYFDARKGTLTPAFDPLDKHPLAEMEMRYTDADDRRRNRPAVPTRSNLCKACPVAYLCPVGSTL